MENISVLDILHKSSRVIHLVLQKTVDHLHFLKNSF